MRQRPRCRSTGGCLARPTASCLRRFRDARPEGRHDRRGQRHRHTRHRMARAPVGRSDRLSARGRERAAACRLQDGEWRRALGRARSQGVRSIRRRNRGRAVSMAGVRTLRAGQRRHGARARRGKAAADCTPLERARHSDAAVARAARRLVRIRRGRPFSFPCRDRPPAHGPDRRLPRLIGSTP